LYLSDFSDKVSIEDYWLNTGEKLKFLRRINDGIGKNGGVQYWIPPTSTSLRTSNWTDIEVSQIHKEFNLPFENPKSTKLINTIIDTVDSGNYFVLDFFSGSATTAQSVFHSNTKDQGKRKFILVQLPEDLDKNSEAFKDGFKNICEIGKERIRQAAKKIKKETGANIDYGFRVYRLDESNMKDIYYKPQDYKQEAMDLFADNVKTDRNADDLLAQVMLDWGLPLSLKIEQVKITGKQVFKVAENSLYACFEKGIDEDFARAIAKDAPLRIVFRDNGFTNDTAKTNVKQLLKQLSPETEMKVI